MPNINVCILAGNLTRDPALSYTPNQTAVVDFGLAINRKWKDQGGAQREEVCFVDCRGFGKTAENINKYLSKGNPILIRGRLTFDQWEAQDGKKNSKHRITVDEFQFVGGSDRIDTPDDKPKSGDEEQSSKNVRDGDDIPF
jgi:single-strand DNA-binding protein